MGAVLTVCIKSVFITFFCSYSIMNKCWYDGKESRPTFLELKEEFDGFISHEERYNYLPLDTEAIESMVPGSQPTECSDSGLEAEIIILESTV